MSEPTPSPRRNSDWGRDWKTVGAYSMRKVVNEVYNRTARSVLVEPQSDSPVICRQTGVRATFVPIALTLAHYSQI